MTRAFTALAFTPSVRAVQLRNGSREQNERGAARDPDRASLSDEMQQRIVRANSVIVGTASRDGWPHVQHRGGPPGLFGAGYIAYTTFIVAYLRSRLGFDAAEITLFWGCVGVAATVAGLAWVRCWRDWREDEAWPRRTLS
jgi:hypothetical protein